MRQSYSQRAFKILIAATAAVALTLLTLNVLAGAAKSAELNSEAMHDQPNEALAQDAALPSRQDMRPTPASSP